MGEEEVITIDAAEEEPANKGEEEVELCCRERVEEAEEAWEDAGTEEAEDAVGGVPE